ncbi:Rossmann-like and DUF2520 domain-containing protein [Noviherbaspirillum sp.]|uniref:Rossmann-like and DUF2520 domain-containing protein n=1 Tax=Noviherbaspirillum sp. TaxID=1926288 RepID=UPI0025E5DC4E|nr:Rossmann-like and DUF2520 domain-containing protein [Noviherbaspirillum sp.]
MTRTINIIGCGNVGKVLGRLWAANGTFSIQHVLNRSLESGRQAASFMQAGEAVGAYDSLRAADVTMIATPDDSIGEACARLARTGLLAAGSIVFHCSGALRATELAAASACGAAVASVHPIRSFAAPEQLIDAFAGTFCGMEGDSEALAILEKAFSSIGAQTVEIAPEFKSVYHAAAVFASNYVVTVLDVALQAYVKAGIPEDIALRLMEPLTRGTVDNVFRLGPTDALTGPIARGDIGTAVKQYRAVNAWDDRYGALYKQLGKLTADIVARRNASKKAKI